MLVQCVRILSFYDCYARHWSDCREAFERVPGKRTQELLGQRDINYTEVADSIGKEIGKPSLRYVQAPDNQLRGAMVQMGMSANLVGLILEMAAALNSGYMKALEPRSAANTTPTSFETFAKEEFLPAYRERAAA